MSAGEARLRDALALAIECLQALVDPDPAKGILTKIMLAGKEQGVPLDDTYDAVVDVIAVLRAELSS